MGTLPYIDIETPPHRDTPYVTRTPKPGCATWPETPAVKRGRYSIIVPRLEGEVTK